MTENHEKARAIFLTVVMVLSMIGSGIAFSGGAAAQTADTTVSVDGSTNYASIQNAVNNATAGDVIEVKGGTYREEVTVNKSIDLVAGSGDVILNGSTLPSGADGINITTGNTVGPTIDGFAITGYEDAVDARNTAGDWTLVNTTVDDAVFGISAFESTGNWTIQNATVTGGSFGVDASVSSGEWEIANTTVRNASNAGIAAEDGTGNGTVYNTTVTNSSIGIEITLSDGDVMITESTFTNNSIGVSAKSTTGEWTIEESRIHNNSVEGLNATGAVIDGNALYNYWGAPDGPSGLFDGSGDAAFGEVEISPYYTDEALTDLTGVRVDANPIVNTTVSSVTPSAVGINETDEFTVNMTIENTTLTDESGDVDVAFENFTLNTFDDDLTINYTSSNISNGTLLVSRSVNATAPTVAGTYAVNLTEIRVDGPLEGPVENGNMTIDTVEVGAAADPIIDETASTVTPTIASPSASQEYMVNVTIALNESLSDSSGGVDVLFEDFVFDTGEDDLTIDYTASNISNGTLNVTKTVNATAPSTTGEYAVNVTDLRRDNNDGSVDDIIQNTNITISNITVVETTWSGSGTQADPYIITNVSQLQDVQYDLDAHYELGNDIDASETANWNGGKGFEPVGDVTNTNYAPSWDNPFSGSFNGGNHSINQLTINRPQEENVGLFRGQTGIINNTSLIGANISGSLRTAGVVARNGGTIDDVRVTGTVSGTDRVGGLAGRNEAFGGHVTNVSTNVSVNGETYVGGLLGYSNSLIENGSAHGPVNGTEKVGGLIGGESAGGDGSVENVLATGSVSGSVEVGGLKGQSWRITRNASATGSVTGTDRVGGLIGVSHNDTINTYATGSVIGSDEVGGLIGSNGVHSSNDHVITSSFAAGAVTGSTNVGGLVGNNFATVTDSYWDEESTGQVTSDGGIGLSTSEMTGLEAETYMPALDFTETWQVQPNDYPALSWQSTSTGDSSAALSGTDVSSLDGTNTTVTFDLENTGETNSSYILNLSLPEGWTAVDYNNDGGDRQDGEAKWLWQTITPNETVSPSVTLEVPKNIEGTYTVSGDALSNDSIVAQADAAVTVFDGNLNASLNEQTIGNGTETAMTVEAPQSDGSFVDVTDQAVYTSNNTDVATVDANGTVTAKSTGTATLNVSYDNRVANVTITVEPATVEEAVDGNNNNQIDDVEILQAITYWQDNEAVPRTDGETVGDFEILDLIEQWRYNTEI